ncbi:MAG: hypothetical protein ACI9BF_000509 [Candidatus Paceibacteria bacterium]|jgi:hypothetical protein
MLTLTSFWNPVLTLGFAIAIDVLVVTLSRFHDREISIKSWVLPLALTHSVFPAIGYGIFWSAGVAWPQGKMIIGVLGFLLVAAVVYEIFMESLGKEIRYSLSHFLSHLFGVDKLQVRRWAIVLSVSWDALLCAPALIPLAQSGNWTLGMTILSFCSFGIIVVFVGVVALFGAWLFRRIHFSNTNLLTQLNLGGTFLGLSVLSGFGAMSLWSAFSDKSDLYVSIVSTAFMFTVFFTIKWQELSFHALEEAIENVAD